MKFPEAVGALVPGQRRFGTASGMRGYSLIELTVSLSIIAILAAIALPTWSANRMNILTARRMVLANLRLARANAITKSIHYQVSFDAGHVTLSAMYQSPANSGTWVADTTKAQTSPLPAGTQVSAATRSTIVEFNTRGMVANASTMTQITLTDSFNNTKALKVWPSGQMNET